jgi:hypothetical protein
MKKRAVGQNADYLLLLGNMKFGSDVLYRACMKGVARAGSEMVRTMNAVPTCTSVILSRWTPPELSNRQCVLNMGWSSEVSCQ